MKRRTFVARLEWAPGTPFAGTVVSERKAFAWNSAIRASEALAREAAHEHGTVLTGGMVAVTRVREELHPSLDPTRVYRRAWVGEGDPGSAFVATVRELVEVSA